MIVDRKHQCYSEFSMEGYYTRKILFTTEKICIFSIAIFFSRTSVLLGGSLVKKLTELYDLTK